MADRLTQLQDCLDELLMQMYATLNYIQTHHPYGDIPGQPSQAPQPEHAAASNGNGNSNIRPTLDTNGQRTIKTEPTTPVPDAPDTFRAALRELAQDLVMQEQKAEILINSLPGIGNSERDQERRMQALESELKQVEAERARAEDDRRNMLDNLNRVIVGLKQT